jgi:hypothetical protein
LADRIALTLRAGDWIAVKTAPEILATLDADGTLDGLPFMPEMLEFCGRGAQVLRPAEKSCVEMSFGDYAIREFRGNDVVLLDLPRCTGANHDGCQRGCVFFWKTAWLRPAEGRSVVDEGARAESMSFHSRLRTTNGTRYVCQSTEMVKATEPLTRVRILQKCLADVRSGSRGLVEMGRLVIRPIWRKATRWFAPAPLTGTLTRTPAGQLNLQPGEWVQIKSKEEIQRTLDTRGRNRGLVCDHGMCSFSGGRFRVRNRLDKMISEPTGEMRRVESTVILDGLSCLCWNVVGGCPRDDYMYWRELWLERVTPAGDGGVTATAEQVRQ